MTPRRHARVSAPPIRPPSFDVALREDRAEAIVLGCAGMADLANAFASRSGLLVIEASRQE